jgi:hypothetical protein
VREQQNQVGPVAEVIKQEVASMFGNRDPVTLNNEFLKNNSKSAPHLLAG